MNLKAVMLATLFFILADAQISSTSASATLQYKEVIMGSVFISIHPQELRLVKNIHLIFDGLNVPIDTSKPAFNNGFLNMKFWFDSARNGFFLCFDINFEPSLENETAKAYTKEIVDEVTETFNFQDVKPVSDERLIRNEKLEVYWSFGPILPLDEKKILDFVKFAPRNGFGKFIDGVIEKYFEAWVSGDTTTGVYPEYWLEKKGSTFSWLLVITGMCSDLIPSWEPKDYQYDVSLKELLNTNLPLVEQPLDYQEIVVEVETNHTELLSRGVTSYIVEVADVYPKGYSLSPKSGWQYWVQLKYEQLFPMEDVTVKLKINTIIDNGSNSQERNIGTYATLIIGLLVFIIALAYIAKKRKGGEKA